MNKLWLRLKRAAQNTVSEKWNTSTLPAVKHQTLIQTAREYGLPILVETGTFRGDAVARVEHAFERIYTIEVDDALYEAARKRFRQSSKIEVLHGDSVVVLEQLMNSIDRPALFWLDAHNKWSIDGWQDHSDSPILEELAHISDATAHNAHVILIDDVRCFGATGSPGYPSLKEVCELVASRIPDYDFRIEHDIMRILPPLSSGVPGDK